MRSSAKTIGLILAGGGSIVLLGIVGWGLQGLSSDDLGGSGFTLLMIIALIVFLPIILGGLFMVLKGRAEIKDLAEIDQQRKLLNLVQTRGQVSISDLVLNLQGTRESVQQTLTKLVGRGLFSGYVDWKKGMLYSVEASKLQGQTTCPNCGGQMELAGKGKITCPFCGAEVFLS